MAKEGGKKGGKKRRDRCVTSSLKITETSWPGCPQGPSFRTLAAHAPSPSAFSTHPCGPQGPGPSAASKANWSTAGHFPEASTWLPFSDNATVSLSCFWAHFAPKDSCCRPFNHRPVSEPQVSPAGAADRAKEVQGRGAGGTLHSAVCTLETSLMNACELGPLPHVTSRTPHLSLHVSHREHPRRKIQVLTPKLRGPLPGVHPGLSPRGVSKLIVQTNSTPRLSFPHKQES